MKYMNLILTIDSYFHGGRLNLSRSVYFCLTDVPSLITLRYGLDSQLWHNSFGQHLQTQGHHEVITGSSQSRGYNVF